MYSSSFSFFAQFSAPVLLKKFGRITLLSLNFSIVVVTIWRSRRVLSVLLYS